MVGSGNGVMPYFATQIIKARRIYRSAFDRRPATAIALRMGEIVAIGTPRQCEALRTKKTRMIDLGDGVVTPGLVDSHTHFFYWALNRALVIDVIKLPTLAATIDKIKREAQQRRVGEWIVARGFDYNTWGGTPPTAADLDRVFPNDAVMVRNKDGHSAWLNSVAMKRAGIKRETPDPSGGRYLRDADGRPTGIVQERAIASLPNPVRDFAARAEDERAAGVVARCLDEAYKIAWGFGFAGVHSMDDGPSLAHLQRERNAGRLGLRVHHAIQFADLDHATAVGLRAGAGDDWLRVAAVKLFSDGALGSQTALMFDEYPDSPGYCGVPNVAGDELKDAVRRCVDLGWPVWVHAIGDRAAHETINAIEAAEKRPPAGLRVHRIEHAQCVRPADIRRMAKLGIIASMQPCHLPGDIVNANKHWPRARKNAYPMRRMLAAGVTIAAGSDVPVVSIDPRPSFHGAVNRTDENGDPKGGWFASQCLTSREVLHAFTRGAADSVGDLSGGELRIGSRADMTLWRDDPATSAADRMLSLRILGAVVNGVVHADGVT